ncbi:MAG: alkaline phosphatase family protein [Acidobacteriota bacterium]
MLAACASEPAPQATAEQAVSASAGRHFQHIFFIMMENHGTAEIIGNTADAPFINSLAGQGGVAMQYFGVTHPSLPNYLSMFSGYFQGIFDDCRAGADVTCSPEEFVPDSGDATDVVTLSPEQIASASATPHMFDGDNLVDRLEDHGLTWTAYMQSIPSTGATVEYWPYDPVTGAPRKLYAQKHNPFEYFSDVRNDPARMQKIVEASQLQADLDANTVPDFVWLSPDQCHDMHGVSAANAAALGIPECGGTDSQVIRLGDDYLRQTVSAIESSRAWQQDSAIVIAWDEDDYAGFDGCCGSPTLPDGTILGGARAPAIVLTSKAPAHKVSNQPSNHYSLLATIEQLWQLDCLGETCNMGSADTLTDLFMP